MPWEILVADESGAPLMEIGSDILAPHAVIGEPEIDVDGYGNCETMRFRINPNELINTTTLSGGPYRTIPPRSIVRYREWEGLSAGVTLFTGVVVRTPSPLSLAAGPIDDDPDGLETVECAGLRKLLEESLIGPYYAQAGHSIGGLLAYWLRNYASPYLTTLYDDPLYMVMPFTLDGGPYTDAPVYLPQMTVADGIDLLLSEYGEFAWGINALGEFFVFDLADGS